MFSYRINDWKKGNSILSKDRPYVQTMNTTGENVIIKKLKQNTQIHFNESVKNKQEKLSKLSSIFALESEKITAKKLYDQKLRLNDDTQVYIKNYRIPQPQREEITIISKASKNS